LIAMIGSPLVDTRPMIASLVLFGAVPAAAFALAHCPVLVAAAVSQSEVFSIFRLSRVHLGEESYTLFPSRNDGRRAACVRGVPRLRPEADIAPAITSNLS
jgi:hypothetical protein